jgi:hypothetical protein
MKRLLLLLRLRWVRGDIRYAEALVAHAEQQRRQIAAWQRDEAALVCELATLPRRDWHSIAFASGIGAALALTLIYGPT